MTLIDKLPQLPADKANHLAYGLAFFTAWLLVFGPVVASAATLGAATLKEIYDLLHRDTHTPDIWDWLATVAGGTIGLINYLAHR